MRVVLDIRDSDPQLVARIARIHLEGVVAQNRVLERRARAAGTPLPPLYESGVRFRNEPWAGRFLLGDSLVQGIEEFCPYTVVLERGWGDCAQLCCARIAQLREDAIRKGIAPERAGRMYTFRIYWRIFSQPDGSMERRLFHVQVRHPAPPGQTIGPIEDPSRLLEY